jgi:hypothetical protein
MGVKMRIPFLKYYTWTSEKLRYLAGLWRVTNISCEDIVYCSLPVNYELTKHISHKFAFRPERLHRLAWRLQCQFTFMLVRLFLSRYVTVRI